MMTRQRRVGVDGRITGGGFQPEYQVEFRVKRIAVPRKEIMPSPKMLDRPTKKRLARPLWRPPEQWEVFLYFRRSTSNECP